MLEVEGNSVWGIDLRELMKVEVSVDFSDSRFIARQLLGTRLGVLPRVGEVGHVLVAERRNIVVETTS